jgi:Spy/CpxP family protein refolding chaperone
MDIFTQKKLLTRVVILLVLINICSIGIFLWKDVARKDLPDHQLYNDEYKDDNRARYPAPPPRNGRSENEIRNDKNGGPPQNDERQDVAHILEHELGLTQKQAEQIRWIRESFFEKEKILEAIIRGERDSMNIQMFNINTNEEQLKSLAHSVSENEYKMELLRIEQAKQLKGICTLEQLEKLNNLVIEIRDYFRPDNRPNRQSRTRE